MITSTKINGLPSECLEVLKTIKGREIVQMSRFPERSYHSLVEFYRDIEAEDDCPPKDQFFSRGGGPLVVKIDSGLQIGFMSGNESLNSLYIWVEENENGECENEKNLLRLNPEFLCIDAMDKVYSNAFYKNLIGKRISCIQLIKEYPQTASYEDLPNEVGLVISMDSGDKIHMSYGGGDFYLIDLQSSWVEEGLADGDVFVFWES